MKSLAVILSLLVTVFAFAQLAVAPFAFAHSESTKKAVELINKSQSALDNMNPTPQSGYCANCALPLLPSQERAQCMTQLCGPETQSAMQIESYIPLIPASSFENEMAKLYSENFEANWVLEHQFAKERVAGLKIPKNDWTESERVTLGVAYVSLKFAQVTSPSGVPAEGVKVNMTYNLDQLKKDMPSASNDEAQFFKDVAEYMYNKSMGNMVSAMVYPPADVLRELHPQLSTEEAFQAEVKKVQEVFDKFQADPSAREKAKALGVFEDTLQFDAKNFTDVSNPSPQHLQKLFEKKGTIDLITMAMDPKSELSQISKKMKPEWTTAPDRRAKILDSAERDLRFFEDQAQKRQMENLYVSQCLAEVKYGVNTLPTQEQNQRAIETAKTLVGEVENKILTKYSSHTQQIARPELHKTSFVTPPTSPEFQSLKKSQVQDETRKFKRSLEVDRLTAFDIYLEKKSAKLELEELSKPCAYSRSNMFDDKSYTNTGSIRIGWGSTRDPRVGRAVTAHELGHRLQAILKANKISGESRKVQEAVIQCIQAVNEDNEGEDTTDEDFADFISAELTKNDPVNLFCSLRDLRDVEAYPDQLSLKRTDSTNDHSNNFYRLIQTIRMKGIELPVICRKAIRDEQSNFLDKPVCSFPEKTAGTR